MIPPKQLVSSIVSRAVANGVAGGVFPAGASDVKCSVDLPKNPEHGDLATNAAFAIGGLSKTRPVDTAAALADLCLAADSDGWLASAAPAKPGFINFRFSERFFAACLAEIFEKREGFGRTDTGGGKKVIVEFVSANPTGPLHVGHGRGAVVGDVVASIAWTCGFDVWREFYVNDSGAQVKNLGLSIRERIREAENLSFELPKDGYHGGYVKDLASEFIAENGAGKALETPAPELSKWGSEKLLDEIKRDLETFGVRFDGWYRESGLHQQDVVRTMIAGLKERGIAFDDPSGAVMLKAEASREFGDDKDRVLVKSSGDTTYFAADIAYHEDKMLRGFDRMINVWGADHHGYIPRVKAGLKALGRDPGALDVILVQMVNVLRDGQPVIMSKRSGSFITLREVIDEVGPDAARLVFCMRRPDAQLDFDLELVKKKSMDNPVFYMQYGHARICSILRKAAGLGIVPPPFSPGLLGLLVLPEERELVRKLAFYTDALTGCMRTLEPHHLVYYINDAISVFHGYYTKYKGTERVVSDDPAKTAARLMMCEAVRITLGNAMRILGVTAPERMDSPPGEEAEKDAG